jgi:predicted nucleic acid-binding protein
VTIFADTSAFLALIDNSDRHYVKAEAAWNNISRVQEKIITSNYIVLETFALLCNLIGSEAARDFQQDLLQVVHIEWVTEDIHRAGISAFFAGFKRRLSLVDCVSFEIMRQMGLKEVFAFGRHFKDQGFTVIP